MRHVKVLLALLVFCFSVSAQTIIKRTLVEGQGTALVMLPGGTVDISALSLVSRGMENLYKVIRMENLNVQYASKGRTLPKDYSVQMEAESVKATLDSLGSRPNYFDGTFLRWAHCTRVCIKES
jgi:hypothetical protein